MEYYCSNCGCSFSPEDKFCPDCGMKNSNMQNCTNCGREVAVNEKYCSNCGKKLPIQKAFKNRGIIIAIAIIIIIGVVAYEYSDLMMPVEMQTVTVTPLNFEIPGDYEIYQDETFSDSSEMESKIWANNEGDLLSISTMEIDDVSPEALGNINTEPMNLMGYDGYWEDEDGLYSFYFVENGYVCIITCTNIDVFDYIEVIN